MKTIKPIKNHIIFQFLDEIEISSSFGARRQQFKEVTNWGFEISSYDDGVKHARIGVAVAVGDQVPSNIPMGATMLIEPLQWSSAFTVENVKYWRTDATKVLGIYV